MSVLYSNRDFLPMKMTETDALILAYLDGSLDLEGRTKLLDWLEADGENLAYFSEIKAVHNHVETSSEAHAFSRELKRLNSSIDRKVIRRRHSFVFAGIAASLCVIFAAGALLYNLSKTDLCVYTSDSGKVEDIILQDGTHVWLAEHSTLSYNVKRFKEDRQVSLVGKAVFDVSYNPVSPVVVNAPGLKVKVLGTVFQLASFSEKGIAEAVLAEGSIELMNSKGAYLVTLSPGQKAVYDSEVLHVKEVRADDLTLIRYGIHTIRDASVQEIVRKLEREFAVRLKAVTYTPKDTLFTISYVKDAKVEDVLDLLETISGSKFSIDD